MGRGGTWPDSLARSLSAAIKSLICALLPSVDLKVDVQSAAPTHLDLQSNASGMEWDLCVPISCGREMTMLMPMGWRQFISGDCIFPHERNDEMKERADAHGL